MPSDKRKKAAKRPSESQTVQRPSERPSEKRRLIEFTPAFKSGIIWMAAAFVLPLALWTLFTAATFAGLIPVFRPNWGWAIAWLLLALPCLFNAARCFNRRLSRHAKLRRADGVLQLHIVDFVIAAHESEHERIIFILKSNRLDRPFERRVQKISHKLDGLASRRCGFLQRQRLFFRRVDGKKLRLFHVRGVIT